MFMCNTVQHLRFTPKKNYTPCTIRIANSMFLILHILVPFLNSYANSLSILPFLFPGTDEVFTVACSPTDASLVASGGKDDRGFLWRIGSAEGALELTGIVCFVIVLICWMPIIH